MRLSAKTVLHINQHVIKANRRDGARAPVITIKRAGTNTYAHEAVIRDDAGREVARVVYRPDHPLPCGAHVWIETYYHVDPLIHEEAPCPAT